MPISKYVHFDKLRHPEDYTLDSNPNVVEYLCPECYKIDTGYNSTWFYRIIYCMSCSKDIMVAIKQRSHETKEKED